MIQLPIRLFRHKQPGCSTPVLSFIGANFELVQRGLVPMQSRDWAVNSHGRWFNPTPMSPMFMVCEDCGKHIHFPFGRVLVECDKLTP